MLFYNFSQDAEGEIRRYPSKYNRKKGIQNYIYSQTN